MDPKVKKRVKEFFTPFGSLTIKKGELIITPETQLNKVFYLESGFVRMFSISITGEELSLHTFRPGSFFPLLLIIAGIKNSYYFVASTSVKLRFASTAKVINFLKNEPDVLFDLCVRLARGLHGNLVRLEHIVLDQSYTQLVSLLLYFANHFSQKSGNVQMIAFPLTHKELAAWIGSSRETISRKLDILRTKNLIKNKGKYILISDIKLLEKELNKASATISQNRD